MRSAFLLLVVSVATLQAHAPSIGLSRKYLNFVAAPGGPNPGNQVVTLTNGTHGRMPWSATVATASGGNWLSLSPNQGVLPGLVELESVNLTIAANSTPLAAGVYYGTITIAAPGDAQTAPADNTPQIIEVALSVTTSGQPAPGFSLAPTNMAFEAVRGSGRTSSLTAQIANAGGGTLSWTATPATDSGGAWLSVVPGTGVNGGLLNVSAAAGDLATGNYTGRVTFTAPGAPNSPQILVSFRVRAPLPPAIVVSAPTVTFEALAEGLNPPPQLLAIVNGGEGAFNWRVQAQTFEGGPWLTAAPVSGSGSGQVALAAEVGNLPPGTYLGRLTIVADGATNSPMQVAVNLHVRRPQPTFETRGIVSAATFLPGPLAPGQIVSIFGSGLGPVQGVTFQLDPATGRVPETLAGTRVMFDNYAAPLFYVSFGQINFQVPYEVGFFGPSSRMVVTSEGREPNVREVAIAEAAPGLFTLDGTRAAALNQDLTLNSPENPAEIGSVVVLYMTGQGPLTTFIPTGALAPTSPPFPRPLLEVGVRMNGFEAPIRFAGLAPGFAGLLQINAEVPRAVTPSSQVRVAVGVGLHVAPKIATIAVR